jgi:exonuclease SbcC
MIRRLELHNFATHEDTEIEFGNGKNIIIGQTGSGKTNLLQAIDFAFLGGEQGLNLEELIADGADSAEVVLDYLDPRTNQNYSIHRTLTRKTDGGADHDCSILNLETNETIKKPDPVRKTLEALGVETSVFRYVVHVPQGKFADILQEGQDRKTILDRLFKVAQLEEAYRELGLQEGPIRKIQERKQANLLEKARLDGVASKLAQEQSVYQKLTQERQTKQQRLDETKSEYEQLKNVAPSIDEKLSRIDSLDSKIIEAMAITQTSKASIEKMLLQLQGLLPNEEIAIIEALDAPRTRENLNRLESALPNLTSKRDAFDAQYTESVKRAASAKSRYDTALEEKSSAEKQLEGIRSYLNGKGEQPAIQCDRCGNLLTPAQWIKHTEEIKRKLDDVGNKIGQAKEQWSNETLTGETIKERLNSAKVHVENQGKAIAFFSQLVTHREERERAGTSESQLFEERKGTVAELRQLLLGNPKDESDDQTLQKSRMLLGSLDSLPERIAESERGLASYDDDVLAPQVRRVEAAMEADKQAKELHPQIELDTKKIEMLQMVRTAFREIQPAVRKSFVAKITASANDYLKRLYGGAEIENFEFSEEYEFIVTRAGYKRHAHRLSGGQQVLASMAFLMALSEVLSELDFLILDEPTTHLDENRRNELVNVLENLRRVPQLIIVDHHLELLAAADTRFQVTLTEGQSHVAEIQEP